jgi:hypothetical protein
VERESEPELQRLPQTLGARYWRRGYFTDGGASILMADRDNTARPRGCQSMRFPRLRSYLFLVNRLLDHLQNTAVFIFPG